MPLFGAHLSVAGGLHNALLSARDIGLDTVQIFTANPQSWGRPRSPEGQETASPSARHLTDDAVRLFRRIRRQTRLRLPMAHASYLLNLASPEEETRRRSVDALVDEMIRAEQLGLSYLIIHPGAHLDSGEEAGLARVAGGLDEVHARCPGFRVRILVETTAGQGTTLGHRFEHLGRILESVAQPERLGACFDTCHVFAAGYALAPEKEYRATMRAFQRTVGLGCLRVFHVNDSQRPLGSRLDRHASIGAGELGLEPFRLLVNDRRFRNRPMVLELPPEEVPQDLAALRGLLAG
jgi:deoxyribonuclease-4